MTTREAFTPEEWTTVLAGPPTAGMIVVTSARGGMWRETFAMSKAYKEARAAHGQSELLDAIVTAKPKVDHTTYGSLEEFRAAGLHELRAAVALVDGRSTPDEAQGYRRFVLAVADRVAGAHDEDGHSVSPGEAEAIAQITQALDGTNG